MNVRRRITAPAAVRAIALALGLSMSSTAFSVDFAISGAVIGRVVTDQLYGGCMLLINQAVANGCPGHGFVSLDCQDVTHPVAGTGKLLFSNALTAFALSKRITLIVQNDAKVNGVCVARAVHMLR